MSKEIDRKLEPKEIISNIHPEIIYNIISDINIEINIDFFNRSDFVIYGNVDITKEIEISKLFIHLAQKSFLNDKLLYISLKKQNLNQNGNYTFNYKISNSMESLCIIISK